MSQPEVKISHQAARICNFKTISETIDMKMPHLFYPHHTEINQQLMKIHKAQCLSLYLIHMLIVLLIFCTVFSSSRCCQGGNGSCAYFYINTNIYLKAFLLLNMFRDVNCFREASSSLSLTSCMHVKSMEACGCRVIR